MTKRKVVSGILIVLLAGALGCACYFGYQYFKENKEYEQHEAEFAELREDVVEEPNENDFPEEIKTKTETEIKELIEQGYTAKDPLFRKIDFNNLLGINKDATRWVYIPDSPVDYPVMQEQEIGKYYYLWRDLYKRKSNIGSILTPALPKNSTDPHLLIFGHSFSNKMHDLFTDIKAYYNRSYFDSHPYVYVYYPDRTERWLAVEVKNVMAWDDVYKISYACGSEEYADMQRRLFSSYRQQLSDKIDGITEDDPLLVLSCCDRNYGSNNNGRAILVCRLADVYMKAEGKIKRIYPVPAEDEKEGSVTRSDDAFTEFNSADR